MQDSKWIFLSRSDTRGRSVAAAGMALAAAAWVFYAIVSANAAGAADLPNPAVLRQALKVPAQTVEVIEPHLSTPDLKTMVAYRGWRADAVLDHILGPGWRAPGRDVEFRALDGYVSSIPAERFGEYPAYLVFESPGRPGFTVDNPPQNEKDVPLGPYYLVWDNIRHPGLLAEGATFWPYQVSEVLVFDTGMEALLPGTMAERYGEDAALARKHCLSCHRINGYGGDKWPIDLAQRVKDMTAQDFQRWVLTPNMVKPGTTMPPLADQMPEPERAAMARRLFGYLSAIPAQTP